MPVSDLTTKVIDHGLYLSVRYAKCFLYRPNGHSTCRLGGKTVGRKLTDVERRAVALAYQSFQLCLSHSAFAMRHLDGQVAV